MLPVILTLSLGKKQEGESGMAMARDDSAGGQFRVAVVDDDQNARLCFKDILQSEKSFTFIGGFSTTNEALMGLPCLEADLALVDIGLPDINGIECTRLLKRLLPHLRVVIMSGNREISWFDRSLDAGAVAYLVKPVDPAQLIATLRFVACRVNESSRISPGKSAKAIKWTLSQRERDVLSKLAEGLLYKEISDVLGISYTAVHKCQYRIFRKLQVGNRSEAVRLWLENRDHC